MKNVLLIAIVLLMSSCTTQDISRSLRSLRGTALPAEGKFMESYVTACSNTESTPSPDTSDVKERINRPSLDYEIIENRALSLYLNGIKDSLLAQWPEKTDRNIQVFVNSARVYSAHSTPWDIVLSMGVIADADSEDELAFIIGHELSHILLGHHDINDYFRSQEDVVNIASKMAMVTAKMQDVEVVHNDDDTIDIEQQNSESTARKIQDAYKISLATNRICRDVLSSKMARENEEEADLLSTDLLVKAGYSAFGYGKALERLQTSMVFTREQLAQKKAEFQTVVTVLSSEEIPDSGSFQYLTYNFANELLTNLLQFLSIRHPEPKDRKLVLATYIKREYRQERRRKIQKTELKRIVHRGSSGRILNNYWTASEALRALDHGEIGKAEKLARKAVSSPTSNHAYTRAAFYAVRKAEGKEKKAIQNLNLIKSWQNASIQTILEASRSYRENGLFEKALVILQRAETDLGVKEPTYPELISVYKDAGNIDKALSVFAECSNCRESILRDQCKIAAGELAANKDSALPEAELIDDFRNIFL